MNEIANNTKAFSQALIRLCRKYNVISINVDMRTDEESYPVRLSWKQGRHGDRNDIDIQTTLYETIDEGISE